MERLPSPGRGRLRLLFTIAGALVTLSAACRLDMLLDNKKVPRPVLSVQPTEVRDSARAGSSQVRHAKIAIMNRGTGGPTLTWSAKDQSDWIHLDPSDGAVPDTLTISLDPDGLDPGTYQGDVTVSASDASAADTQLTTVSVTFLVQRPGLNVSPTTIQHSASMDSNATFTDNLTVSNNGTGALDWTASDDQPWITLGATSGSGGGTIPVTINTAGLSGGTHHGTITITAPGAQGSPAHVAVTLTVLAPGLAVSPTSILDSVPLGKTTPKTALLHVTNSGNGTINWTATKSQPWLTLSKTIGGAPDDVVVTMNPTGLPPGMQRDTIVFTAPGAAGSLFNVPVQLTITSKPCTAISLTLDVINKSGTLDATDCYAPHRPGSLANVYSFNASAGDTISMRMTAQFDAYLILSDYAGNVLAENDECPGETGTACIMNYSIGAGGQYFIEATSANPGATGQLTITVVRERPPIAPQLLGQFRADGTTAIVVGDTTPETDVVIEGRVNDPNLNETVRLEVEVETTVSPFTGVATQVSDYVPAATSSTQTVVHVTGLTTKTAYRWQARSCDNTGRCSAWLPFGNNADTAADFVVVTP